MNVVTYVSLVLSIGLLVDFIMHIFLRFLESDSSMSREDRVKETLQTMGSSIFVGGVSTFLGVVPVALSTSFVLRNIFACFFAMVVLGICHGLMFLPVVLSFVGPTTTTTSSDRNSISKKSAGTSTGTISTSASVKELVIPS